MKTAVHRTTKNKPKATNQIRRTSCEVFPDGSMVELVTTSSTNGNKPALLFWDGDEAVVSSKVEYGGQVYQPIELHATLQEAIRLPVGAISYGTAQELFTEVASVFGRYAGFSKPEADAIAMWSVTTWFPDCLASPPALLITGPAMNQAVALFRLLSCVCRHPLMLADISRSAIRSLPMHLRPTLLINQPDLSSGVRALWCTSNYAGMLVPGKGGSVLNIGCPKVLYSGLEEVTDPWSDTALHMALPPRYGNPSLLEVPEQSQIADHLQPRLLMYRLQNFRKVRESRPARSRLTFPTSEVARSLAACIQGEPDFAKIASSLLERQEQDLIARRSCDANIGMVEVIWVPSHEAREISVSKVTELTNVLLRCRGETLLYGATEIGWRLKNLGIYRHRNGKGMVLRFSQETRLRIHQLVRQFGLSLPAIDGCRNCAPPQGAGTQ